MLKTTRYILQYILVPILVFFFISDYLVAYISGLALVLFSFALIIEDFSSIKDLFTHFKY